MPDDEKLPLLRAYLKKWAWEVGAFFQGVGADARTRTCARIAPLHPILNLAPPLTRFSRRRRTATVSRGVRVGEQVAVAGIGGIAPGKRDLEQTARSTGGMGACRGRSDRAPLFFLPLALVLGALASLYAYAARAAALRGRRRGGGDRLPQRHPRVGDGWTGGLAT